MKTRFRNTFRSTRAGMKGADTSRLWANRMTMAFRIATLLTSVPFLSLHAQAATILRSALYHSHYDIHDCPTCPYQDLTDSLSLALRMSEGSNGVGGTAAGLEGTAVSDAISTAFFGTLGVEAQVLLSSTLNGGRTTGFFGGDATAVATFNDVIYIAHSGTLVYTIPTVAATTPEPSAAIFIALGLLGLAAMKATPTIHSSIKRP